MPFWKRFSTGTAGPQHDADSDPANADVIAGLQEERDRLRERLNESERTLRERTEALYALLQQSSSEHFEYGEAAQLLKIERLRNAGAYAQRDVILERAKQLQVRIAALKVRLRAYEPVDDVLFDNEPIVREDQA